MPLLYNCNTTSANIGKFFVRTKNLYSTVLICFLSLSSFIVETLLARTYYVDDDGGPGIDFTTIQAAANVVNPGDTVIVKDGTYVHQENKDHLAAFNKGGSASGGFVTVRSENPGGAVIDASGATVFRGHAFLISNSVEYLRIEGFEIKNAPNAGIRIDAGGADHIEIIGNNIHHNKGAAGISVHGKGNARTTNLLVDGNFIHHNGDSYFRNRKGEDLNNQNKDHGMYISPLGAVIRNNVFSTHEYGWAIQMSLGAENVEVYNNVFAYPNPNRNGQIMLWQELHNISIKNNIFFEPKIHAIGDLLLIVRQPLQYRDREQPHNHR